MNILSLYNEAEAAFDWIVAVRRELHKIPEEGFKEYKTQKRICQTLDELGIPYHTNRTWTVADIIVDESAETYGLRADIDALPLVEPEGCPFRSQHEGWMHACGHDVHTAILLGAARLIMSHKAELKHNIRLFFQPAEETDGGAKPMIEAGEADGVARVYGLHLQPYMETGKIDSIYGTLNASCDEIDITVKGLSAHAARPHLGIDALAVVAELVTTLQTVVSRSVTPLKPAVLSIGTIHGGTAGNVLCDKVEMRGTMRTADGEIREKMIERVMDICEGLSKATGAEIIAQIGTGYAALVNHSEDVDRVFALGRALLGAENVLLRDEPSMGGEDFSFFVEKTKGAFWHLGCTKPGTLPAPGLHTKEMVVDENCMKIGVAMQAALAMGL